VKRFELQGDDVVLYFEQMNFLEEYCVALDVNAVFEVYDAKEANVKVYDYYQPEYQQSVAYYLPNSSGNNFLYSACSKVKLCFFI
jgi:hypothetical protein